MEKSEGRGRKRMVLRNEGMQMENSLQKYQHNPIYIYIYRRNYIYVYMTHIPTYTCLALAIKIGFHLIFSFLFLLSLLQMSIDGRSRIIPVPRMSVHLAIFRQSNEPQIWVIFSVCLFVWFFFLPLFLLFLIQEQHSFSLTLALCASTKQKIFNILFYITCVFSAASFIDDENQTLNIFGILRISYVWPLSKLITLLSNKRRPLFCRYAFVVKFVFFFSAGQNRFGK